MRSLPALFLLALLPATLTSQAVPPVDERDEYFAGSELESYLRTLQTVGAAPIYPWSLRKFSPREADGLHPADSTAHPWRGRYNFASVPASRRYVRLIRPQVGGRYNSSFPWGLNDGAVWAGRGVTGWASGGVSARWGSASLVLAPLAFQAQNASFPIMDNGRPGRLRYGDGRLSGSVDYPQRFGDSYYGRVDLGESTLRVDYAGIAAGVSSAHEWWGPAQRFPFLLGTNAAGFPHAFVGTSQPANLWLVKLHGRVLWGGLDQSAYFEGTGVNSFLVRSRRFATGLTAVVQPRGFEQLELGVARFIHAPQPDDGLPSRYLTRAFEGILKKDLPRVVNSIPTDDRSRDGENQLASIFARLTVPAHGFEIYGELGREDHLWDRRDALLAAGERGALTLGFAKAWQRTDGRRVTRLRAEAINFQQAQVDAYRGPRVVYIHGSGSNQGHTQRGQLLGAGVGVASAAGSFIGLDALQPDGRWTLEWTRIVRQDQNGAQPTLEATRKALDVVHAVTIERLLFRGPLDLLGGASAGYNFNRDFGRDRANATLYFSVTGLP